MSGKFGSFCVRRTVAVVLVRHFFGRGAIGPRVALSAMPACHVGVDCAVVVFLPNIPAFAFIYAHVELGK